MQRLKQFRVGLVALILFVSTFGVFPLSVSAATITLSPTSGVSGQEVFVTGTTFDLNAVASFTWDGVALTTLPSTVTTTAAGALPSNVSFVVPSGFYGAHTVRVSTSSQNYVVASFTITTPAVVIASPTFPTAGLAPGVTVTLTGTAFEASKVTSIYYDGILVTTATTTVNGAFDVTFALPSSNNAGTHLIRAQNSNYAVASVTVVIAAAALTLSPSTSVAGLPVMLTGTNFYASAPVYLQINGSTLTPVESITANGAGSFVGSFLVPDLIQGSATIKAYSNADIFAVATLTLSTPAITLSPATAAPGQTINITGTNFKANQAVTFLLNGTGLSMNDRSVVANSQGIFTSSFVLPAVPVGTNILRAQSFADLYATTTVTVSAPALTLSPTSGSDGILVFVNGTGLESNKTVSFYINGTLITGYTATTNSLGAFNTSIKLPDSIPSGAQIIRAQTSDLNYVQATYTVTAATVVVSPTASAPGSKVTITGLNFDGNARIYIKWNGSTWDPLVRDAVYSNSAGSFVAVMEVPASFVPGANQIEISTSTVNTVIASFTVAAPTITLSATSGGVGDVINITGAGLQGNVLTELYWDDLPLTTNPARIVTTPLGGFFVAMTVPSSTRGSHTVSAKGPSGMISATTAFSISNPSISFSNSTGPNGKTVTVTGYNFAPHAALQLIWDLATNLLDEPIMTDGSGAFSVVIDLPENASVGSHQIKAFTSAEVYIEYTYTVTTGILSIENNSGIPGSKLLLIGTSYDTDSPVVISWDDKPMNLDDVVTDGIGGFSTEITIPEATAGSHKIKATTSEYGISSTEYVILTPSISVASTYRQGDKVVVNGSNFTPGKVMAFKVNGKAVKTEPESVVVDQNGAFTLSFVAPINFSATLHISAQSSNLDQTTLLLNIASHPFILGLKWLFYALLLGLLVGFIVGIIKGRNYLVWGYNRLRVSMIWLMRMIKQAVSNLSRA